MWRIAMAISFTRLCSGHEDRFSWERIEGTNSGVGIVRTTRHSPYQPHSYEGYGPAASVSSQRILNVSIILATQTLIW